MRTKSYVQLLAVIGIAITAGMVMLAGCSPERVSRDELVKYLQDKDHGLVHRTSVNGIGMRVSYQPRDLLIWQEVGESKANARVIDSVEKKYSNQEYFTMGLSRNNQEVIRQLGGFSQYSDMLQVLSFQMADKVLLISDGRDTVASKDYVFQQTFGMGNENSLLFVFDRAKLAEANEWTMYVKEFGLGLGIQKFVFRRSDVERVPRLKELTD
ncbi:MAG TPA: hypothetical protein VD996_11785 [Chitinophagaceae bacterium]|nr:hypothetical protein [Chitinophagaceae bacterium]